MHRQPKCGSEVHIMFHMTYGSPGCMPTPCMLQTHDVLPVVFDTACSLLLIAHRNHLNHVGIIFAGTGDNLHLLEWDSLLMNYLMLSLPITPESMMNQSPAADQALSVLVDIALSSVLLGSPLTPSSVLQRSDLQKLRVVVWYLPGIMSPARVEHLNNIHLPLKDSLVKCSKTGGQSKRRDSFMQAVQTWCNVENIHVFGCVIYTGNDKAVHQAQGIFAGSSLCMQLAGERQTDIARLLDYLTTIIKYKVLSSMATIPLPTFAMLSGRSYDHVLALKPQESTCDRNQHVLPLVVLHKLYQVEITCGQRNVPWKTLLDLLFTHKYTIVDWPAGVPAISQHFNVKHLTADELHALTVPFLKEQMGNDYHTETRIDDDVI
ncbi:hypothetical protein EDD17DRAFT_1512594 [Pisolithus thermaeus]|nr:hypothetical protein EDD17DRAFT_1512594 [Pisolithus thermaeus]